MKQISISESTVGEAMAQVDALESCSPRNRNCLRLLTEEMFSMIAELLKTDKLDFRIDCEGEQYALCVRAQTRVSEGAREHFLSMSTDGRNAANKGIKGMLGAVIDAFSACNDDDTAIMSEPWACGISPYNGESHMWALSTYMHAAPKEKIEDDWDGMEKSIIANFADDVIIGVRAGWLEMSVTKKFA